MTETEVYARLTEMFRDVFLRDDIVLTQELTAADVAGWDSMKQVDLVLHVEECFSVKLTSREIDRLRRVGDFADLIMRKTA